MAAGAIVDLRANVSAVFCRTLGQERTMGFSYSLNESGCAAAVHHRCGGGDAADNQSTKRRPRRRFRNSGRQHQPLLAGRGYDTSPRSRARSHAKYREVKIPTLPTRSPK